MNRFEHLNPSLKPLSNDHMDSPPEKLPDPNWISVSKKECDEMFEINHQPTRLGLKDYETGISRDERYLINLMNHKLIERMEREHEQANP